jgi:hypothetical protein
VPHVRVSVRGPKKICFECFPFPSSDFLSIELKRLSGSARPLGPTYAGANLGHPSSSTGLGEGTRVSAPLPGLKENKLKTGRKEWRMPNTYGPGGKRRDAPSLEHLAMKNLVLFLTRRTSCTDTAGHQQGRADGDENCRAVSLKLKEPACEGV